MAPEAISQPTVSVILPTYNRSQTLDGAARSVLDQSYSNTELIVVDDGSSDGSSDVLEALAGDPRVEIVRLETNRGAAVARNSGLARCRGRFVAFQDSDDRWEPGALATLVTTLDALPDDVGVAYGWTELRGRGPSQLLPDPRLRPRSGMLASVLAGGNVIGLPSALVRRETIERVGGFDPELPTLEDWELWLRLARVTAFRFVPTIVAVAGRDGGVNRPGASTLVALERIERRHADLLASPRARVQLAYLRGRAYGALGHRREMRRSLFAAVAASPRPKAVLAATASLGGPLALEASLAAAKAWSAFGAGRRGRPLPAMPTVVALTLPDPVPGTAVVIPTRNGGGRFLQVLAALAQQSTPADELIVIDSESRDGTVEATRAAGATLLTTDPTRFRHGAARNAAAAVSRSGIVVFMTQDALPDPECLERLVAPIREGRAAASYARQLPVEGATPLERFARSRNYPNGSASIGAGSGDGKGVRRYFFSNSCSAVRADVLAHVGGFDERLIMNEDMNLSVRLQREGYAIAYCAAAIVHHSHDLSISATFRRYFDVGVALSQSEPELRSAATSGAGLGYVRDLTRHLLHSGAWAWIPVALAESGAKWLGHAMGRRHRRLPPTVRRRLSLHRAYWDRSGCV
jgi:rhamnosyltransferase